MFQLHLGPDDKREVAPEERVLAHPPPLAADQHHALQVGVAEVGQDLGLQLLGQTSDVAAATAPSMHTHFGVVSFVNSPSPPLPTLSATGKVKY